MKCKKCNTDNDNNNKFCIHCGSELNIQSSTGTLYCPACGIENNKTASFCAHCGNNLSSVNNSSSSKAKNKRNPKRQQKKQPQVLNFSTFIKGHKLITTAVVALLIFLVYQSVPHSNGHENLKYTPTRVEGSIASVMYDSVALAVVKNFNCSCGECTDPLDTCTCNTANEERSFIKTKVAQNISVEGIITAVENKYGGKKSIFESNSNG